MALAFDDAALRRQSDLVWIEGRTFMMGSDHHYPEEAPAHPVKVDGFWIERTPVTNRKFMEFAKVTGYVTVAETIPDPNDYPGARPEMLRAGSLVFTMPKEVSGPDISQWWTFKFGANWRRPLGGLSDLRGKLDHPVVHVAYPDAKAYAEWAGMDLPTEAEWELAGRGGLDDAEYAWGDELTPAGKPMANIWQGTFPTHSTKPKGCERTTPVGAFPPNGYGLHDMIGNVWEWTSDFWSTRHPEPAKHSCCIPTNPRGGDIEASFDPRQPQIRIARRVLKGGSHLCAPNYCRRYRPAARHAEPEDTSTSHVGFRCVKRAS
ncbi:formylglycine-generating enzyme required for sulfatase activity [Rhizobium sp. BK077]|uniref:formylglycine-generating enzyme family protein n=1 Tax=Rhizobium TaxID=379 RepID=UPI0007B53866|nr:MULTISPECIES: formylglycine-generating enzyme family protein [Rhizobium]KZS51245.1 gliding motility-associated lipoprotein GldK [Rhizobium anhuiense bv. trifolii]MBB3299834.1 formylglycine-generating enzyme required for sulfatase activity [Rhizobium sp. BK112]MBB3368896.1 formylglycine-generating enzyme required for sulfatase activity [Rhizobium sp. BK077]MBB4179725.1 formylglycine-generating enzyme required for sulfatase activity [Rhizobium sp. BK109]